MAPPAHIERALTSVGLKPTCGPEILTASRSALMTSVLLIVDHFPFLDTSAICKRLLAPCCCICATNILITATANARGFPVSPCTIDSPLVQLF